MAVIEVKKKSSVNDMWQLFAYALSLRRDFCGDVPVMFAAVLSHKEFKVCGGSGE